MTTTAVQVNNLGKQYRLGLVGTGTLSHDLQRWWLMARGKEDPYLKLGGTNLKESPSKGEKGEFIWALKDISFMVEKGEVLGIIGKNGAGKTTLLKILSRITAPSKGNFKARGRIASLLEVGTGFHPDLTGKENIYLNGTLLGMTRMEIKRKFDEIASFSGVERYIDTPVKRYSSGMYVRLAFAVAASLEAEILVIDEVLAAGDADFQKKCLGKIKDVAGEGRTVLFVSHTMTAIKSLCRNALLLENGMVRSIGAAANVVDLYISENLPPAGGQPTLSWNENNAPGNEYVRMLKASVRSPGSPQEKLTIDSALELEFVFRNFLKNGSINISLHLHTLEGNFVLATPSKTIEASCGLLKFKCKIPGNLLNSIAYKIDVVYVNRSQSVYVFQDAIRFEMIEMNRQGAWFGKWPGVVRPEFNWEESTIAAPLPQAADWGNSI